MTRRNTRPGTTHNQGGFSLIEVLIALVIMSVGMLGIAGLYVEGMNAGRTSIFRHHAVTLAGDVADRIRANPRAGNAYAGVRGNNNCVLGNVNCDPEQMAANDIDLWKTQADDMLPNGDVTVTYNDDVVPPTYTIAVSWEEAGADGTPTYTIVIPVLGI
ncbi:MAG: type IV pilus modification protein PilV [Gammaproteobacteria bacterium]|nr:type IV pilus modification protein PilV [Gammaproteobacteria bacterium]MBT8110139.1 type IV pilus modification protein PilV [Gammaproteobacteria bacterium]NND47705.1 type IV pilus modification protein PilV [Woeseiaceae bacterium]NNL44843.1 type IV pilus modification protein PilV [Woeseiaceae bacterium]